MTTARDKTTVRHSTAMHLALWTLLPTVGALLGFVLSQVPTWISALAWFPNQDKISELADVIGFKATLSLVIVGLLIGGFLALMAYDHIVSVTIDGENVTIKRSDNETTYSSADVKCVFVDDGHLVLLGASSEELAREETSLSLKALEGGFTSHGYSWRERDPYADLFTRWVDGATALSQDANAILRARQAAVDSDDAADQRELRTELARQRIVVRDAGKHQYWRRIPHS